MPTNIDSSFGCIAYAEVILGPLIVCFLIWLFEEINAQGAPICMGIGGCYMADF